ncbi:hypothetical protein HNQ80_003562 [Anaerosolibacter carboniphilus]|uniref:Peptidase M1 membrane alanine aminopeptidase domain-containing protein n=1 Tax=Anaerosolibacter carboniphilus TaxID=1417629 RepID=A0A841KVI4_9FIRM|nr:M1 family metallopeptidase [Anaerosolibacter carboniphilus]MBB6217441.1 hypothetical protein [Anaerosolibacter carboniphilus]
MNKRTRYFIISISLLLVILTGCKGEEVPKDQGTKPTLIVEDLNGINIEKVNLYNIDAVFSPEEATLQAKQQVNYINQEDASLEEIYFHLYPNAFRTEETAPFLFDDFQRAYPNGFEPGYIELENVVVNGQSAQYEILGDQKTIMKIKLTDPLAVGARTKIEMSYTIKLPPAQERFGYGEETFNFGNWYPVAAVYDASGWNLDPYYPIGDPFYSDVSNYDVTIRTPKDMIVAASGNIRKDEIQDKDRLWKIEAKLMRDFAWVASKNFEVVEKDVEGTTLKMYYIKNKELTDEIKEFTTVVGEDALKVFNKTYGKYPYGQYSIVQTNFPSGMEYPGIVFIGKDYYNDNAREYLEIVIVHETAHQWWYGVVGNDEIDEAWLDESLTAYGEVIYAMEIFGEKEGQEYEKVYNEAEYNDVEATIQDKKMLKSLDQFEGWDDYGPLIYNRGSMFMNEIYEKYGKDKLYNIFAEYYDQYRFKNATTENFKAVCEAVLGEDVEPLFQKWLHAQ